MTKFHVHPTFIQVEGKNIPVVANPIVEALRLAVKGDDLFLYKQLPGFTIGDGRNTSKHDVSRNEGVQDITFTGVGECVVGNVTLWQKQGWNKDLHFQGITFKHAGSKGACFFTTFHNGSRIHANLSFEDCVFRSGRKNNVRTYWGFQGDGRIQASFSGCLFVGFSEHGIYLHQGSGDMLIQGCWFEDCDRTGFQLAGRDPSIAGTGEKERSFGTVTIKGNTFLNCSAFINSKGLIRANGSNVTIAGHLGHVAVINNHLKSTLVDAHGNSGGGGGIVIYRDHKVGSHLTPDGYAVPSCNVSKNKIEIDRAGSAPRELVMLGGIGEVNLRHNLFRSNHSIAVQFDHKHANGTHNLKGSKTPAYWRGWKSGGGKIRIGGSKPPQLLSNKQINALAV